MALDLAFVGECLGDPVRSSRPVSGGDVARAYRLDLDSGRTVFAKTHPDPPANFFTTEARGLAWLHDAGSIAVPEVLVVSDETPVLVLEWIDESDPGVGDEAGFGGALAELHACGAPGFGRQDRRTTGSRGLPNELCGDWVSFYATQRLLPLCRLARDGAALAGADCAAIEDIAGRLQDLGGPPEPPARLHGDLWAGNRVVDRSGTSWLIDPACHGGHREFDLAMMRLFGGFGEAAFAAYAEAAPLADGWRDRVPLHQLAPLLVHTIKFGGGYVGAVREAARRYPRAR